MSNAVWCDGCGSVFPEDVEGSEAGVGSITRRENGRTFTDQQTRHFCPICVAVRSKVSQWSPNMRALSPSSTDTNPQE
jgi:hypothetical protein